MNPWDLQFRDSFLPAVANSFLLKPKVFFWSPEIPRLFSHGSTPGHFCTSSMEKGTQWGMGQGVDICSHLREWLYHTLKFEHHWLNRGEQGDYSSRRAWPSIVTRWVFSLNPSPLRRNGFAPLLPPLSTRLLEYSRDTDLGRGLSQTHKSLPLWGGGHGGQLQAMRLQLRDCSEEGWRGQRCRGEVRRRPVLFLMSTEVESHLLANGGCPRPPLMLHRCRDRQMDKCTRSKTRQRLAECPIQAGKVTKEVKRGRERECALGGRSEIV